MPNWATVTRKIYGTKENMKTIENAIVMCETANEPIVKNGFGKLWLGCIVTALNGDWEKVGCRGEITSWCQEEDCLVLESMEAWGEQSDFRHFLEQYFTNEDEECMVDILYYCSEPGMGEYYTNDSGCNKVNVEIFAADEDGYDCDYVDDFDAIDADDAISSLVDDYLDGEDVEFTNIEQVVEAMKKQNMNVYVHEYEYNED